MGDIIIKKLFKNTALYGIVNIFGRFVNYLLVPLYARFLSPSSYGVIIEIYSLIAIFNVIYTYGLETAFFRFSNNKNENILYNKFQTLILSSTVILSFITALILYILHYQSRHVITICGILFVDTITVIPFAKLRQNDNLSKFISLKLIQIFANVVLNIIFICYIKPTDQIMSILFSNLLANTTSLLFIKVRPKLTLIEYDQMVQLFKFCYPLVIVGIFGIANSMWLRISIRYILPENFYGNISNETIIGIVGANYKIGTLMLLFVQTFRYAADPILLKLKDNTNTKCNEITLYFAVCAAAIWMFTFIFRNQLCNIILHDEIYKVGSNVIPLVSFNCLLYGFFYNLSIKFKLVQKNHIIGILVVINFLMTMFLSFILIPKYGYIGGIVSNTISYIAVNTMVFLL